MPVEVKPQPTPNPNAMKFNVSQRVVESGSRSFATKEAAAGDPLARRLFELPGVNQVFMLNDFITINKTADGDWDEILPRAVEIIGEGLG